MIFEVLICYLKKVFVLLGLWLFYMEFLRELEKGILFSRSFCMVSNL